MRVRVPSGSFALFEIVGFIFRVFWSSGAHFPSILRLRSSFCSIPEAPELFLKDFEGSGATNSIILHKEIQTFSHFVATMSLISSCCTYKFIDFIVLYLHTQSCCHSLNIIIMIINLLLNLLLKLLGILQLLASALRSWPSALGFSSRVLGFSSKLWSFSSAVWGFSSYPRGRRSTFGHRARWEL